MNDQRGRPIVVLPETLKRATRLYEMGLGTIGWEEIDYAETNFFVHSAEDFQLEIVFALDFTNSMAQARLSDGRSGVQGMLDAFEEALSGLLGAQRVGVVEFHDRSVEPQVLSALTSDRDAVLQQVKVFAGSPYEPGSSIVWDSIQTAAGLFTSPTDGSNVVRALIFISDGRDTSSVSVRDAASVTAAAGEIQLYAVGVGEVFEGEQLEAMVRSTGGAYYPTRELDALQDQLGALVRDLRGQFRVSYVTLRRNGVFNTRLDISLQFGVGSLQTAGLDVASFYGPDNVGRVSVDTPTVDEEAETAQTYVRALHIPRDLSSVRFRIDTRKPLAVGLAPESAGGLLQGWQFSGPDAQGYYQASNSQPLAFGAFGALFQLTLFNVTEDSLEVPIEFDNGAYGTEKSLSFPESFFIGDSVHPTGSIAFLPDKSGNPEIYVVGFHGLDPINVSKHPHDDFVPSWSPDGSQIAFSSSRDVVREVFAVNRDGTNLRKLTSRTTTITRNNALPAWSPDGSRIAFDSDRDGNRQIYVMGQDGSNQTRLTDNSANDWWAAWSSDGSQIAFTSDRERERGDLRHAGRRVKP